MRIKSEESIAVIIDIQERLFPHIHQHEQLERNCNILIAGYQALGLPVIVTEQYSKGLGPTITSIQSTLSHYQPLEKMSFSCCGLPAFTKLVTEYQRPNIILCGIESHVCVLQTAVDLKAMGFQVTIVADCISSRKENDHRIAEIRMQQEKIILTTYESLLFEMCRVAGSDIFKAISKLVK